MTPTLPAGFETANVATGAFSQPTAVAYAPDGRKFVAQKGGSLSVITPDGQVHFVLDISAHVNSYSDRGLLGVAVDKDFATNHWVYLLYVWDQHATALEGVKTSRLTRITVNNDNTVVNPSNPETVILGSSTDTQCPQSNNTDDCIPADFYWHTIGTVRVDPVDGTLWLGTGDATESTVFNTQTYGVQDENSFRGKIIHIAKDGKGLAGHPFCPSDTNLTHVCTKIYAKGFRNPFRFSLRPNKFPVAGDVGNEDREEVDVVKPGGNYGWPCYEGDIHTPVFRDDSTCTAMYANEGTAAEPTRPVWSYPHSAPSYSGAVGVGPAYSGNSYPSSYKDDVFVFDYSRGWIQRLKLDANDNFVSVTPFAESSFTPVDVEADPTTGDISYIDIGYGSDASGLRNFRYTPGNASPVARATGTPTSGAAPLTVTFDASASSDADGDTLSYDWDFGDGSAHGSGATPSHQYTNTGTYTAKVTVSDGRGGSSSATVGPIGAGNSAPVAHISSPANLALYRDGSTITVAGSGTDGQDGTLPGTALSWHALLIHGNHTHDLTSWTGTTGSFNMLTDHDADSHIELTLTVTDSAGLTGSQTVRLNPETVKYTLASSPAGAPVTYGATDGTAPMTRDATIAYVSTISAGASFDKDGATYVFEKWSDGGARAHNVTIPTTAATLTATYDGVPTASATQSATAGNSPLTVNFDASASSDPDSGQTLTYDWDFGDGSTHAAVAKPSHTYSAVGTYTPKVTVTDGHGGSSTKTLSAVTVGDGPPAVTISLPTDRSTYRDNNLVSMSGSATDAQDGSITGSALTWKVTRHTGSTTAAVSLSQPTGGSTSFTPSNAWDADTYYDITLSATDSTGHVGSKTVRIDPQTVEITLASSPAGAPLKYYFHPVADAPFTRTAAIGYAIQLVAPETYTKNGVTYAFTKWSDNLGSSHWVIAPATATTYTATFDGLPTASAAADKTVGLLPLNVAFDGSKSSDPDAGDSLTYDWDFGDGTAHGSGANPTHSYTKAGEYTPRLVVTDKSGKTAAVTLPTITAGDTAPAATISAPTTGTLFSAGASIPLSGSASDAEDGTLSGNSLKWQVTLHRGATTTALTPISGATGTLTIPANPSVDDWYDVAFSATDSLGVTTTKNARLDPRVGTVSLASDPAGAALTWNGTALSSVAAVVGTHGTVGAPDTFSGGGHSWLFSSWSDGGAQAHDLTVAASNATLTASYAQQPDPPADEQTPTVPPPSTPITPVTPHDPVHPGGPPAPTVFPVVDLRYSKSGLRMSRSGAIRIPMGNRNALAAIGSLDLRSASKLRIGRAKPKVIKLAKVAFIAAPKKKQTIVIRLSRSQRKIVQKLRRVKVDLILRAHDKSGRKAAATNLTVLLAAH